MAFTVNSAFEEFNKNIVNLDPVKTKRARSSRDWLIAQINSFPEKIEDFPDLYKEKHIKFGSFARNTKIRPLDDIDLIITFSASDDEGNRASYFEEDGTCYIIVPKTHKTLRQFCDGDYLNSRKIIEKLKRSLNAIPQYENAEIHRNQEAVTLRLTSYEWNFDIVPAFFTVKDFTGRDYYIIPNGKGNWKKTDPRIDQQRVIELNRKHNGKVLQLIRTLKYWKKKSIGNVLGSYLFENFVLDFCEKVTELSDYIGLNLMDFWEFFYNRIYDPLYDPKGIQGDLNYLPMEIKESVSTKAYKTYKLSYTAISYEIDGEVKKAIKIWKQIFGDEFPDYG